jgi:hypothetical protein
MVNIKPHIAWLQATDKSKASFKQAPSTLQAKFKQGSSQVSKQGFRHSKELSGGATVNTVVSVLLRAIVVVASLVTAKDLKDSCHSSRLRPPFGIRISARACLKKQQLLTTTTTRAYHNTSMASTIPCRLLLLKTLLFERAAKSSETRRIIIRKGFSTSNFERIRFAKRWRRRSPRCSHPPTIELLGKKGGCCSCCF